MRLLQVKIAVSEVKEHHQVMGNGRALKTPTLARVNKGLYEGEDPVPYKCLILLAKKCCACQVPNILF